MSLDPDACYRALRTHDPRFDGRFFVGVSSTRIYCRPVCTVELPRRENCHFFASAAAAEVEGYRPCLRCRPELAPGNASVDAIARLAQGAVDLIENGVLDAGGIEHLSDARRRDEPPSAADLRCRVRRFADRVCADAAAAAREAASHRYGAAGDRSRARERIRERAPLQRAVQGALSDGAGTAARRARRPRASRDARVRARVSAAVRLGRDARVSRQPRDRGRGDGDARRVCAKRCGRASGNDARRPGRGPARAAEAGAARIGVADARRGDSGGACRA